MKPKRKKIPKLGWGVRWDCKTVTFYPTKSDAAKRIKFYRRDKALLFCCKIEEVVK